MGNYFIIVNYDKKEYIDPAHWHGVKYLEILLNKDACVALTYALFHCWSGDRIYMIGDEWNITPNPCPSYYHIKEKWKDITQELDCYLKAELDTSLQAELILND